MIEAFTPFGVLSEYSWIRSGCFAGQRPAIGNAEKSATSCSCGGIIQRCGNHGAIATGRCVATPHPVGDQPRPAASTRAGLPATRSEEHTSELQSLMRISYAVFCLK